MWTIVLTAFGALMSCLPASAQQTPDMVPPLTYRNLTCPQIVQEGRSVSRNGFALSGLQPGTGGSDLTQSTSALIIFWPIQTDPAKLASLRYANSQMDALEEASVRQQCSIQFLRQPKG